MASTAQQMTARVYRFKGTSRNYPESIQTVSWITLPGTVTRADSGRQLDFSGVRQARRFWPADQRDDQSERISPETSDTFRRGVLPSTPCATPSLPRF